MVPYNQILRYSIKVSTQSNASLVELFLLCKALLIFKHAFRKVAVLEERLGIEAVVV